MGGEFSSFSNALLNPQVPVASGGESAEVVNGAPASNQSGVPQGELEQATRETVSA